MRPLTPMLSLLALGCTEPADQNVALMDKIEASVVMPAEARALDQYARYYARERDGSVRVVLMAPRPKTPSDTKCEEMGGAIVPCEVPETSYPTMKAGERIWLKSSDDLPGIADGGCSVIEIPIPASVVNAPDRQWRIEARCNGR